MSTDIAVRPTVDMIRREVAEDPARRAQLQDATGELLDAAGAFLTEYVALPEHVPAVLALYALHTWVLDACDATPYLVIVSAEKGSGKTRLLEALSYLVHKPWQTANTTPTALFRRMSEDRPTLLLDELDAIFRGGSGHEALRQVLNAGNRRGSTITRCDGRWGTVEYDTFGAKVLAGIDTGFMPETVLDRAIVIHMRKRADTADPLRRLRPRAAAIEAQPLANTLGGWALVVVEALAQLEPDLPPSLSDRAADAWEPLLAIADFAAGDWPARARSAAQALSCPSEGPVRPAVEDASAAAGVLPGFARLFDPQAAQVAA